MEIDDTGEAGISAGNITLWIGNTSFPLDKFGGPTSSIGFDVPDVPDLDWEEEDEVKVVLSYTRVLPSAPTNVSVTAPEGEEGTLEVSWDEADDGTFPIECYLVEFRHPSGEARDRKQSYPGSLGPGKGCGDSPTTSVKRTDLEPGVEYQVLVQALSGDGYGDWSETKTAPGTHGDSSDRSDDSSGQKKQSEEPASAPDKPTGLEATATHDSVTLTWDDPGDDSITGYAILRRIPGVDPQGHFNELVANTGSAATTYTDNTVAAETRYTYRIKAINGAGTSERSRWYHIDTPEAPVPDKPTDLEATATHDSVTLTWDDPGDDSITGYVILRRVRVNDQGGDFSVLVADTGSAATTYTDNTRGGQHHVHLPHQGHQRGRNERAFALVPHRHAGGPGVQAGGRGRAAGPRTQRAQPLQRQHPHPLPPGRGRPRAPGDLQPPRAARAHAGQSIPGRWLL